MPVELLVAASDGAIEQQPPVKLVPIADYSAGASAPLVPARGADAVAISTFHPILHFIPFSIFPLQALALQPELGRPIYSPLVLPL